jgi:hypothetical protein
MRTVFFERHFVTPEQPVMKHVDDGTQEQPIMEHVNDDLLLDTLPLALRQARRTMHPRVRYTPYMTLYLSSGY